MARRVRGVLGALLLVGASACSTGSDDGASVLLDGSPRHPDAEGVATVARAEVIEVAGTRYEVSPDLVVFSTHDLSLSPLVRWEGSYVQVGLDGDRVVWLAGVAGIITGDRPVAEFSGQVRGVEGDEVILEGGTVVRLGPDVAAPEVGTHVLVQLDPIAGRVRRFVAL